MVLFSYEADVRCAVNSHSLTTLSMALWPHSWAGLGSVPCGLWPAWSVAGHRDVTGHGHTVCCNVGLPSLLTSDTVFRLQGTEVSLFWPLIPVLLEPSHHVCDGLRRLVNVACPSTCATQRQSPALWQPEKLSPFSLGNPLGRPAFGWQQTIPETL